MTSDFLSKERIEQELKEDFGNAWNDLDDVTRGRLMESRIEILKEQYTGIKSGVEKIRDVRQNQAQLYIGITFGLAGGLAGSVMDRLFGEYFLYDVIVVMFFVGMVIVAHRAYGSLVKEIADFATYNELTRVAEVKKIKQDMFDSVNDQS